MLFRFDGYLGICRRREVSVIVSIDASRSRTVDSSPVPPKDVMLRGLSMLQGLLYAVNLIKVFRPILNDIQVVAWACAGPDLARMLLQLRQPLACPDLCFLKNIGVVDGCFQPCSNSSGILCVYRRLLVVKLNAGAGSCAHEFCWTCRLQRGELMKATDYSCWPGRFPSHEWIIWVTQDTPRHTESLIHLLVLS